MQKEMQKCMSLNLMKSLYTKDLTTRECTNLIKISLIICAVIRHQDR